MWRTVGALLATLKQLATMCARPAKAASATEMLEELLQCRAGKAAELSFSILQDQQRTITALEQKLTNQELWQRKTEKT